jgi:hypothetical protein
MENLCNNETANYLITYIRWLTACYMKMNDFLFEAFVEGDVAFFCQKEVEALDVEADQPQIIALTGYLQMGVEINSVSSNGDI